MKQHRWLLSVLFVACVWMINLQLGLAEDTLPQAEGTRLARHLSQNGSLSPSLSPDDGIGLDAASVSSSNITFNLTVQRSRLSLNKASLQQQFTAKLSDDLVSYFITSSGQDTTQATASTILQVFRNSTVQMEITVTVTWPDNNHDIPRQLLQLMTGLQPDPTVAMSKDFLSMYLPPNPVVTLDAPAVSDPALQSMLVFSTDTPSSDTGMKLSIGLSVGAPFLLMLLWSSFRVYRKKYTQADTRGCGNCVSCCINCCPDELQLQCVNRGDAQADSCCKGKELDDGNRRYTGAQSLRSPELLPTPVQYRTGLVLTKAQDCAPADAEAKVTKPSATTTDNPLYRAGH